MFLGGLLGLRRKFTVCGVRYREVTSEPLRRALSQKGSGRKSYEVAFPDGSSMRIEATVRRRFADITGPQELESYRPAERLLRPGMRAVILESGTGAAAEWAARLVGAAGAVVALERDEQSVDYAQRRYALNNVSHELGGITALAGETDGAFQAALAVDAIGMDDDPRLIICELWRTLGSEGVLLVGAPVEAGASGGAGPRAFPLEQLATAVEAGLSGGPPPEQVSIFRRGEHTYAVARRQSEE